jgi:hypothetical protein
MFWYLHPLKTCKSVPISLKHIRLGVNQVPHSLYPNHRVESESKTYLYHGTTQTFARVRGLFQITDQVGSGKESMAPKRSHSAGVGREASAATGKELPAAAGKELLCPGLRSWWQGTTGSTAGRRWWSRKRQRGRRQQRVG